MAQIGLHPGITAGLLVQLQVDSVARRQHAYGEEQQHRKRKQGRHDQQDATHSVGGHVRFRSSVLDCVHQPLRCGLSWASH